MSRRLLILLISLAIPFFVLPHSAATGGLRIDEATTRILLREGQVRLALENSAGREIAAHVRLELLDPNDNVRAAASSDEKIQPGASSLVVPLSLPTTVDVAGSDQLLWYRLRLRISPASSSDSAINTVESIIALSEITPDIFELQVAAPQQAREGTRCRLHVRAMHPISLRAIAGVSVAGEIKFADKQKATATKAAGTTNAEGYVTLDFNLPGDIDSASGQIKVVGQLGNLVQEASNSLHLDRSARILLNTDKPLYQPGQIMHLRALIFDPARRAMPETDANLEISDEESETVFRTPLKTSRFGIASADWKIPENTRLGDYTVKVQMNEADDGNSASQIIKISRYDLPNFAVSVKPDRDYYLPGQNAEVEVRGDYLFGEPVKRGHVRVVRETERTWNYSEQKYETTEGEKIEGEIDAEGRFIAHINLEEEQKVSTAWSGSQYRDLTYAAYLTDPTTNRTEQRRFDLRLTKDAIHIYVTEANNNQAEGLPLEFYISANYADGTPAQAEVAVKELVHTSTPSHHGRAAREEKYHEQLLQTVRTNRFGLSKVRGPVIAEREGKDRNITLILAARDRKGKTGSSNQYLNVSNNTTIRVETDKTLYRAGDPIKARIIANKPDMAVIVDVARDREVIRSEVISLRNGQGFVTLPYSNDFRDRMTIAASSGEAPKSYYHSYRDYTTGHRAVLYPRDRELKLDVQMGQDTYRPGEEATAALQVYTPDGRPVEGALGVVILDKAVEERARTNQEFGTAYGFYNNFHSFLYGPDSVAGMTHRDLERLNLHHGIPHETELAAELLLQRAGDSYELHFSGRQTYIYEQRTVFNSLTSSQLRPITTALQDHYIRTTVYPVDLASLRRILAASGINFDAVRDPWGVPYRAAFRRERGLDMVEMVSAGPDKHFGTTDDFSTPQLAWPYFLQVGKKVSRTVADYHARTGGFIRDAATLKSELWRAGLDFDMLRDHWGKPYYLSFDIAGTAFLVNLKSNGPNGLFEPRSYASDDFTVWTTTTNYFTKTLTRIDIALKAYSNATGRFPVKESELREALRGSGIKLDDLRDPWGGRFYVDYSTEVRPFHSIVASDTEESDEQSSPSTRLVVNTRQVSSLRLFSLGRDGRGRTFDDVNAGYFVSTNYAQRKRNQSQRLTPTSIPGRSGSIGGTVLDPSGGAIAGARVIITGENEAELEVVTNDEGRFEVMNLEPGRYAVRIEQSGFKTIIIELVEVVVGKMNNLTANLEVGGISEVVTVSDVAQIDQTSTAVGANLNDRVFQNVPVQRNALSLFYLAPGATDNLSVADGVNTSDNAQAGKGMTSGGQQQPISTPRLREYFPETLLWQPALETDAEGRARLNFKLADNITTWKMSVIGSTLDGEVGTAEAEFRAFQPFFVEHDPPRVLTEGDEIELPVVLRNYMDTAQAVELEIKPESWFTLLGPQQKRAEVAARDATRETFSFRAVSMVKDGKQRITAAGPEAGDAIEKPVSVHPDGQEVAITDSEVFTVAAALKADIPVAAINGAMQAELKIYPNLMAHVAESVEGILQRPYGCGEQTISSTYPSVMVVQAYKRNGGTAPLKARRYVQEGYERLLNYRAESGGFSYWGRGDANLALTAYALRLLNDAKDIVAVDEAVIRGAREWLIEQQNKDGSWRGHDSRVVGDSEGSASLTSLIARVLATTNAAGTSTATNDTQKPSAGDESLARAFAYLSRRVDMTTEPYLTASYALAALHAGRKPEAAKAISKLRALARSEGGLDYWAVETSTPFYGWGLTGQIETTALAVQALARWRELERTPLTSSVKEAGMTASATNDERLIGSGLRYLLRNKDRYGVWYSTQATVNVLDALITMNNAGVKQDAGGAAEVIVNGRPAGWVMMPSDNQLSSPLVVNISEFISQGNNRIEIRRAPGSPPATAQLVTTYWIPWAASVGAGESSSAHGAGKALRLTVAFDKTEVKVGDEVTCKVNVERLAAYGYGMILGEVGLPPGADVDRASLERAMKESGWSFSRYDILPDRLVVYLWPYERKTGFEFKFRPRFGLAAQTAPSVVYDYYNPEARTVVAPTRFVVR